MEQQAAHILDRTFTVIETWGQFLEEWQAVRSEGGAVGLLYAGTRVPLTGTYKACKESFPGLTDTPLPDLLKKCIEFYLLWARHENNFVATTAQQLIVKHWLREAMKVLPPDDLQSSAAAFDFLGAHEEVLWFLRERRPSLLRPPYPRFIRDYLMGMWDTWFTGRGLAMTRLRDLKRPAHEWKLFDRAIHAFVTWGLGDRLAGNREMAAETITCLTTLLAEHGFNPASILANLSSAYEPIEDLSGGTARIEHATLVRASAALLTLQHVAEEGKKTS